MNYQIIIPAHNEEAFISKTLDSIVAQTAQPQEVILVNDNSNDQTEAIIDSYCKKHSFFKKLNTASSGEHMPGSKVVNAFNKGYQFSKEQCEIIVKLDADLILPDNYFETVLNVFKTKTKAGIVGGFAWEEEGGEWKLNHPMNKDHVRGAFKAYRRECFEKMDGLRSSMGWDTADELLAKYYGYEIITLEDLQVKHLRPTGKSYNKKARLLQGEAMYKLRYGIFITAIASAKMAWKQKKINTFSDNIKGYLHANSNQYPFIVNQDQGQFIRKYRIKGIVQKLF